MKNEGGREKNILGGYRDVKEVRGVSRESKKGPMETKE